jgi:hypothetical protein
VRYSNLSRMVRDTFAVPSTGAGVEREFSKSGRGTRSRLNVEIISEVMMYKNFLTRRGKEIKIEEDAEMCLGIAEEVVLRP